MTDDAARENRLHKKGLSSSSLQKRTLLPYYLSVHTMKVLIVGCGLAGLATALALVQKGVDDHDENSTRTKVIIVERRTDFTSRGATFGLAPNGQKALEEISPVVLKQLKEIGVSMPQTSGYMLPWWSVRDALLEQVRSMSDRITLHMGIEIESVEETSNGLFVTVQNNDALKFHADVLVGADGVHSYVRSSVLNLPAAVPTNAFVWRGSVDSNASDKLKITFQESGFASILKFGKAILLAVFNFHPKVQGGLAWVCSISGNDLSDSSPKIKGGETTPMDMIHDYMNSIEYSDDKMLQDYEKAKLLLENTRDPTELTWSTEMAVTNLEEDGVGWGGRGRITLIGDAAHSIRPASGLGGSLAFEDAALLGRAILDANRENGDRKDNIVERLRSFEAQRLPRCQSISRDQTIRSQLAYKIGYAAVPPMDPEYRKWIFDGPNVSPEPPVDERIVFGDLID